MYLFFDTETTGVPAGADNIHMVELAWVLAKSPEEIAASAGFIVKPDGFIIPDRVAEIHGITTARALAEGLPLDDVMLLFTAACSFATGLVGHNITFDLKVLRKEFERLGLEDAMQGKEIFCTMRSSADLCDIRPPSMGGKVKPPKLAELHRRLFPDEEDYVERHHAVDDTLDTMRCFWELRRLGVL